MKSHGIKAPRLNFEFQSAWSSNRPPPECGIWKEPQSFWFCILEEIKYSYHSTCGCANFEWSASLWVVLADKHHRNNEGIRLTFLAADMPLETFLISTPMETGTHHWPLDPAGGTYLIYRPVPGFHLSNSPMKWNSKPAVKPWILIDRSIMHIAFGNSLHSFPAHSGTISLLMLQKNAWALSHPLWKSYLDRGTESPPGLRKHSNFNHDGKESEGLTSAEWPQAKLKLR